ncbi:MbeB family mobilization protein, partial [Neisseria gonorrhoeae]|uniref:MbeB family mobilization protein n=1 Tax=Neisseria gonorrhoeae TaxID=485 RepID=UPI0035A37E31
MIPSYTYAALAFSAFTSATLLPGTSEAASIEQQTKADLETLRKNINEALKQSEQKITADINARQLR